MLERQKAQVIFYIVANKQTWLIFFVVHNSYMAFADKRIDANKAVQCIQMITSAISKTGRGSSIGSMSSWHASGPEFDPHFRHILLCRCGHENISTAILPLPQIQEEQLSVTGETVCTKYW